MCRQYSETSVNGVGVWRFEISLLNQPEDLSHCLIHIWIYVLQFIHFQTAKSIELSDWEARLFNDKEKTEKQQQRIY